MEKYTLKASFDNFDECFKKAKIASAAFDVVEFEFNGIICLVNEATNKDLLFRDYCNAHTMDWLQVGPDCKEAYDPETQKQLDVKNTELEAERKKDQDEYDVKMKIRAENIRIKTAGIEFECIDEEKLKTWKENNSDPYGGGVITYAMQWALLMQAEIKAGHSLISIAEKASHEADTEGITGAMYGFAVSVLVDAWKYGEELRVWHNKEYNHEGAGVVNPAIVTLGVAN